MDVKRIAGLIGCTAAIAMTARPALAQDEPPAGPPQTVEDLAELSIEELAQVQVHSASKQAEPLSRAPTSLFVIGNEDILRSAATSLPEVLRLAPNLQVQQLDARQYAVTARGFNGYESSNKLLVLIDGRSIYTPLHSGVFWDLHAPLLEDIEQIEVISGPGGTLFGPNAVNGVVNIASRDARDTLGGLVRATAGPDERTGALRYGFGLGPESALRVYATGFNREEQPAGLASNDDGWRGWQAGFRADFGGGDDHLTIQGDIFDNENDVFAGDGNDGHNLLARWTRRLGEGSSFQLQAYYDDFERRYILVRDRLETFDVEGQFNTSAGAHELVLGGGVRTTRDEFINNLNPFKLDPESKRLWVYNFFANDRIRLSPELALIAGLKVENSTFSGWQVLPSARLAWQPGAQTLFWAAVSRAVRTPSRIDRQLAALPILAPAPDFRSEKLLAFEAGYRGQPFAGTSLSVSLFFNRYDDIRTTELTAGGLPIQLRNGLEGHSYGIEAWSSHQLLPWWRLSFGGMAMGKDFATQGGVVDISGGAALGDDPDYQLFARSSMDISRRLRLDAGLRLIGGIDTAPRVGSHVEADARLGYAVTEQIELYVAGTNLLHRTHLESNDPQRAQRIERSLHAGTRLRF